MTDQRKPNVDLDQLDLDNLPKLEDWKLTAVLAHIVDGKNKTEAFLEGKPHAKEWQRNSIWTGAYNLFADAEVKLWIDQANKAALLGAASTIEQHRAEGKRLAKAAENAGVYGAAATVWKELGRVDGHVLERSEVTVRGDDEARSYVAGLLSSQDETERAYGRKKAQEWGFAELLKENQGLPH